MFKELITKLFDIRASTLIGASTLVEEEDGVHEKIKKEITNLLANAGFPNIEVTMTPTSECSHIACYIRVDIHWENIKKDVAKELQESFIACIENTILIAFNEILGPSMLVDKKFNIN